MKKIIIIFLILVAKSGFSQEKVNWMSFEEAIALNQKEPRKIFVDVYTDWCGWCKKMDATSFSHPYIAQYLNKFYYPVKLDAETKDTIRFSNYVFVNPDPKTKRSTHQLASSILDNQLSYPTVVVLDEKIQRLQILPGYRTAQEFESLLKYFAENSYIGTPWEEYIKTFQPEIK